jgi:hypothetical protein
LDAHDFKLLRKEESEESDLDEGLKPGQGSKPGWMLKADPKLGAAVKAAQDLAKKRKASYGNPAAGKSVKEEAELDEAMSNDDKSSIALKALVAKKNLKQSGDKVKSVDFLKKMKDRVKDGENLKKEEVDRVEGSDSKTTPSGRKSHQQIVFKGGDDGKKTVQEAKMTDDQMEKREEIVKSMKKDIAGFKDRYGDRAKDVMYATATKMAMKEDNKKQDDLPFTPDKPKKTPVATPGKYGIGPSTAKHLAKMAMQKQMKKEEVEQISEGAYERAEENKRSADAAKKQGNMFDHHLHMADHHGDMSEWHSSKGRHGEADKHAEKSEQHQELAMKHKMKKEETELDEQAPVAPGLMKHRISVTVSEPDHPMVSKRKEKVQKTVIVTHSDNKEGARRVGEKFYAKKGYRVHDSHHAGIKEEVELDEAAKGHTIEAHGIKGMKRTPWRKTFKHEDHLNDWAEKNDADVHGTRDLEHSKKGSSTSSVREEVGKLERLRQGAQSYRARAQGRFTKPKNVGQTHDKDPHGGGIFAKSKPMKNEEVELDEVESNTLSYKDFVSSLLEYEAKDGVYRHSGTYGSEYAKKEREKDDNEGFDKEPTKRGPKLGSKRGPRANLGSSKLHQTK